ncbi:ribonuclease HI family protein [Candidatus Kaiserbacteria bacterium]|nr:ribonuclease HI family protein [Candidatus Kaiserbacteria bacterium]
MTDITIYTDGGARNNPGPAGAGIVIIDKNGKTLREVSKFLGTQTNNWAEYEAVVLGFKEAKKLGLKGKKIEFKLDSELVAEQLSGRYQIKEPSLFGQFIAVHNFRVKDFPRVTFTHIPREKNKKADSLANEAMDQGER